VVTRQSVLRPLMRVQERLAKNSRAVRGVQSMATMRICAAPMIGMMAWNIGEDDQDTTLNTTDSSWETVASRRVHRRGGQLPHQQRAQHQQNAVENRPGSHGDVGRLRDLGRGEIGVLGCDLVAQGALVGPYHHGCDQVADRYGGQ
jgi:hypothetical protein